MRADKRLGQHFLRDIDVLQDIAALADVAHSAGVLEIGPGEGAMTAFLLQSHRPVVAIDKDPRAVSELEQRFGAAVRVVEGDALTADLGALLPPVGEDGRLPIVVGNLPYNVGSAIYRRLLGLRGRVERLVLMLQREVALRIVAEPGTKAYGVPSVMTALTASAHIVREVPPEAFVPRPKVHSAVVLVEFPGAPQVPPEQLDGLGRFIGTLFQARRKMLSNTVAVEALALAGIDPSCRPEQVSPGQLVALWRIVG
jgi:16S rRNA (adenine1518-N6/adenine1519-N6)-dimethyltransferase